MSSKDFLAQLQSSYKKDLEKWGARFDFNHKDIKPIIHWATSTDGYFREPHYDTHQRLWNFIIFLMIKIGMEEI